MICTQCQTENEAGRKFCMECGARLISGCPNCGAQNPEAAKFCGECGTPLGDAAPRQAAAVISKTAGAASAPAAERRLVSVLFADLVGFTTMAQDLDPEDTREFLTSYFDLTRTIIERYGGTVEKFIGDAVMAVWGAPTAHEDDAERAVRAALEVVGGVPKLSDTINVQVRAGVLTGEAAVTIGASGQGMVAGDLVNTASRLQSVAPPGAVLVGEATYRAASGAIGFEEAGEQVLKGKEAPVPAWRATAVVGMRGGSSRSDALEPPFTGRDEELRLIKELFHATEREHKSRLALIVGQGGIGKSRLAWEFEKYLDGLIDTVYWHNGRSPAYGEGISFWALAEMVRGRAGIAETDPPELARERLHETLAEWLPDEQERRWVEPRLAALLALEPMLAGSRDELFAAWRTFFERIAERGTNVLVFEDVQWADDGMLDFIAELLERARNQPILVIALARPDLHERRSSWGANLRSLTTMNLEPLSDAQMEEMVRGTVPGIASDATAAIVERAEGIPLYAVETIRMLLDLGNLRAIGDSHYELVKPIERLSVPETLHALIAARLDALGERDRRLLQTAAVVGLSFTLEALAAVADEPPEDLRERLAEIVRRQLLHVDVDPRSPERGQYQFVQAVVREVAEGSLSRADRRALHIAAARYYESLGDEEVAGILASHYVDAYRATPAGPEADALAAQARVSLRGAAERAAALHSHAQALSYLEQALAVTTDSAEQSMLHERAANAAMMRSLHEVAMGHGRAVEEISRASGDELGVLRGLTLQASTHLNEHGERPAIALLLPVLNQNPGAEPTTELVHAQAELARALMLGARYAEAIEWCDRALSAVGVIDDEQTLELLITKGTALTVLSRTEEGAVLLRGAIFEADRLGLIGSGLRARNNLLGVVTSVDLVEALDLIGSGYAAAERIGVHTWAEQLSHVAMSLATDMGDWDSAWLKVVEENGAEGFYGGWRIAAEARVTAYRGDIAAAREKIKLAREMAGTASSQGVAAMASYGAEIELVAANWDDVMSNARMALSHADGADYGVRAAIVAALAADRPEWIEELMPVFRTIIGRGRLADGFTASIEAARALLADRWSDARSSYLEARRDLAAGSSWHWLAQFNLAFGVRAEGKFPEAAEAIEDAERFFRERGAESFVERFEAAVVAAPAQPAPSRATSEVPAS